MNRTILIVICDFLLVSLLAFSTVDINRVADQSATRGMRSDLAQPTAATNEVGGRQDLGDVMRLALEDERKNHEALSAELSQTRLTASQQQALLNQRTEQLQSYQQQLRSREDQASSLQTQQTNLLRQMSVAQNSIQNLNQQLHESTLETLITKEQRAAQEAEVRKQLEKAAILQQQLSVLEKSNQLVTAQRELLANQLQLTEVQKQAAAAQLAMAEQDLTVQRQENTKLAEGVKALAGKSSELAQEIHANRTLTPNTIFTEFVTNRVTLSFYGVRPGFFGTDSTKYKQTQTILITDGTNVFSLCHVQDTLLALANPATPWEELTGTVGRNSAVFPIQSLYFDRVDPRVALLPVPSNEVSNLGARAYPLSKDPYKFQDAVVVGAQEGYYGESQFQVDLSTPQYLKMDHNSLKGLFGKFNPSTGDLVFSRTGELIGVMVNSSYCLLIRNFDAAAGFHFGADARGQPIAETLASLYTTVIGLPFKLQ